MRALESKQMLKMSSSGMNTCSQSHSQTFAALINCVTDDVLFQAMPHIDKMLLQFIQVMNFCLVDPLLYFAPYLIAQWTIGGHRSGAMNAVVSRSRSLIVSLALEHCLAAR